MRDEIFWCTFPFEVLWKVKYLWKVRHLWKVRQYRWKVKYLWKARYLWKVRYICRFLFLAKMKSLTAAVSGSENAADPLGTITTTFERLIL